MYGRPWVCNVLVAFVGLLAITGAASGSALWSPQEVSAALMTELIGGADCRPIAPLVCNPGATTNACPLCTGIHSVPYNWADPYVWGHVSGSKVTCGGIKQPGQNCDTFKVWTSSATCGSGGA